METGAKETGGMETRAKETAGKETGANIFNNVPFLRTYILTRG